ncbi:hypothetical protein L6R52_05850 [Myxococcota bacterium]|nr:hypothetical protein [Myxococcota bacterium]
MRAVVVILGLSCIAASGGACASCASALEGTVKLVDAVADADERARRRALEQKNELVEDELRVRRATSALRDRARDLQAELAARADAAPGFAKGTVVALFDVDGGELLDEDEARELSERLHVELAASGTVRLVPPEAVEDVLERSVEEGYGPCFDEACRIELGKALAAQKVLVPVLLSSGDRCVLGLEVYDLEREVAEWATSVFAPCGVDELTSAAAVIAARFGGLERTSPQRGTEVVEEPNVEPARPPRRPVEPADDAPSTEHASDRDG